MRHRRLNGAGEKDLRKGAPSHEALLAGVRQLVAVSVARLREGSAP